MRVNASLQRVTALNSSIHPAFKRTPSFFLNSFPEMRRFARGWTTLVFYSNRGNKKKGKIFTRREVEWTEEGDIICFCVLSAILSAGNLDQGGSTDVRRREWNFVIGGKVQWEWILCNIYIYILLISNYRSINRIWKNDRRIGLIVKY